MGELTVLAVWAILRLWDGETSRREGKEPTMTIEAKVNSIGLGRWADLAFSGENIHVAFGKFARKDILAAIDAHGADRIVVNYRTVDDPKEREKDAKKFGKWVADLGPGWEVGPWSPRVIRGYTHHNTMECIVTRKEN
jgi:hypothetical protein